MNILFAKLWYLFAAVGDTCNLQTNNFFGIPPWYKYLQGQEDAFGQCVPVFIVRDSNGDIVNVEITLVVLAIIDALMRVGALVAVGFVIYGGIQFIISQGEPDKTNSARNTIINALVGLAITLLSAVLVSFIGGRLT